MRSFAAESSELEAGLIGLAVMFEPSIVRLNPQALVGEDDAPMGSLRFMGSTDSSVPTLTSATAPSTPASRLSLRGTSQAPRFRLYARLQPERARGGAAARCSVHL